MPSTHDRLDNILDLSLERVIGRRVSVEECLEAHPDHAEELRPLLLAAVAAQRASLGVTPRVATKEAARQQMLAALAMRGRAKRAAASVATTNRSHPWWLGVVMAPRWVLAPALSVLFVCVAGFGTVAASQGSMPDDLLYPVKRVAERVQMAMVFSDEARFDLYLSLADRRADEVVYLARSGKMDEAGRISKDFQVTITQFKAFAEQRRAELQADWLLQQQRETNSALLSVAQTAPDDVRSRIESLAKTLDQGFTALGE